MADDLVYEERVSSKATEALFLALAALFVLLLIWRLSAVRLDALAVVFVCLSVFFLFYAVNYQTLVIRLTPERLALRFGLFTWKVPLDNVEACRLDDIPTLVRLGDPGIHFMGVRERYRASFNLLEHPRVVIAFKSKVRPVQDLSFSTRHPKEILRRLQEARSAHRSG